MKNCATLSLLVILACSSPKPAGHFGSGQPDSGTATGGSSDAGSPGGADASSLGGALNSAGGQSGSDAGAIAGSAGYMSNSGGSSSTGGTAEGGVSTATGGLPAGTGGSQSPGLPTLCSPDATPGPTQSIAGITLDAAARFAAITPDELTMLWTVPSTGGVTVYVSDRTSIDASWGTPQSIANVPAADNAITVTPDGLVIAYVDDSDRLSFATTSRVDRTSAFAFPDPASGSDFAVLNTSAALGTGDTYAYPLYGPYSTSFYYAVKSTDGNLTWYETGRFEPQDAFTIGTTLDFSSPPAPTSVLSGISSDENTLFFADSSTNQSTWTFFDEISVQFDTFLTLGALGLVQPNQACNRVYGGSEPGTIFTSLLY